MKVVCINNYHASDFLTIGRVYDAIKTDLGYNHNFGYKVLGDKGKVTAFATSRFELLEDIRDKKLNQLI